MAYKWREPRSYRFEGYGQTVDYSSRYKIGSGDNYRDLRSSGYRRYGKYFTLTWDEYRNRIGFNLYRYE